MECKLDCNGWSRQQKARVGKKGVWEHFLLQRGSKWCIRTNWHHVSWSTPRRSTPHADREKERKREREKDGVRASQIYFSKLETTGSMRSEDFQDIPQLNIVNITQRGKRMLFSFMTESSQMFSSFHGTCCWIAFGSFLHILYTPFIQYGHEQW